MGRLIRFEEELYPNYQPQALISILGKFTRDSSVKPFWEEPLDVLSRSDGDDELNRSAIRTAGLHGLIGMVRCVCKLHGPEWS